MKSQSAFLPAIVFAAALAGSAAHAMDRDSDPPSQAARIVVASGPSWKCSASAPDGWKSCNFDDSTWADARSDYDGNPAESFPQLDPSNCFAFESTARWIWGPGRGRSYLRKRFSVEMDVQRAFLVVCADNQARIWINGAEAGFATSDTDLWGGRGVARAFNAAPFISEGVNVIAIEATDRGGCLGVCLDLRIDGPPFAEIVKSIIPGVPPRDLIARWRTAFDVREYQVDFLRNLYASKGSQRNCVMHLRAIAMLASGGEHAAAVLGKALLDGAALEKADAAECISLLELSDFKSLVMDAFTGPPDWHDPAWLKLALLAADCAGKGDLGLLDRTLAAVSPPEPLKISDVAAMLEAGDPVKRAESMKILRAAGQAAMPALREIAASGSPAARARAAALLCTMDDDPLEALGKMALIRLTAAAERIRKEK